jgi:redox-sensitive bicupin YhaK (pirin superfamily)
LAGFPRHPHRGIETVTYMLEGTMDHEDSRGNAGRFSVGDVQRMTAGSMIIHQEMPGPVNDRMGGFQLWVNLPRASKMMDPWYQEIKSDAIPVLVPRKDISIRVITGKVNKTTGPVRDIVADPEFLDITLGPDTFVTHPVKPGHTALAYVIGGEGTFDEKEGYHVGNQDLVLFGDGTSFRVRSSGSGMRFLFLSQRPIGEPVAWRGPIVMNTREELRRAYQEYADGTFIKKEGMIL